MGGAGPKSRDPALRSGPPGQVSQRISIHPVSPLLAVATSAPVGGGDVGRGGHGFSGHHQLAPFPPEPWPRSAVVCGVLCPGSCGGDKPHCGFSQRASWALVLCWAGPEPVGPTQSCTGPSPALQLATGGAVEGPVWL